MGSKRILWMLGVAAVLALTTPKAWAQCKGDIDGDNSVTVDEIITAVTSALSGCAAPLSIVGLYSGQGVEVRQGCTDPLDNGTVEVSDITFEVRGQTGSSFEATLSLVDEGQPLVFEIEGAVDSDGLTRGVVYVPGQPFAAGDITGRLVGDILSLSARLFDPECQSVATTFIGVRD